MVGQGQNQGQGQNPLKQIKLTKLKEVNDAISCHLL